MRLNALDTVAMQKDAYASHLYWYTDIEEAKRIAKVKNKPILTLRLLGNLRLGAVEFQEQGRLFLQ